MKTLMISTALVGALALPAVAQTPDNMTFLAERPQGSVEASTLIGSRIYASANTVEADAFNGVQQDWSDIGEVNDIVLSRDGQVEAVLVDVGGFLGIGERQVAVEMSALRFVADDATDADDWFIVMTGDRALLESAPAWNAAMSGTGAAATDAAATGAAAGAAGAGAVAGAAGTVGDPNAEVPAANEAVASVDAGTANAAIAREGYAAADATRLTSENLTGATVYDSQDASIGEVSDLVLTEAGQVSQMIVDVGGFLGIGEKPVALEMSQVQVLQADGGGELRVYVPMTREQLEALPSAAEG